MPLEYHYSSPHQGYANAPFGSQSIGTFLSDDNALCWCGDPQQSGVLCAESLFSQATRMSKIDRIKEELGWLKVAFAIFAAIDVSLIAWVAQNYQAASGILVGLATVGIVVLTAIVFWINRLAMKRFKELEDE